jgi:Tol biopolymer transport system component
MPDKAKPWHNVSPTWSPDSAQIAFLTDRTGRWQIWAMNAGGSNSHPLFSNEINNQLHFTCDFVAEQVLSWR